MLLANKLCSDNNQEQNKYKKQYAIFFYTLTNNKEVKQ